MRYPRGGLAFLLSGLVSASCGDDGGASPGTDDGKGSTGDGDGGDGGGTTAAPACSDGEVQPCDCPGGAMGEATCSGGMFGACECPGMADDTSTGDPPDDTGGSTGEPTLCGNGVVDQGEQCDDGDRDDADECSNECVPHCGLVWELALFDTSAQGVSRLRDGSLLVGAATPDATSVVGHQVDADGRLVASVTSPLLVSEGVAVGTADPEGNLFVAGEIALDGEAMPIPRAMRLAAGTYEVDWDVPLDPAVEVVELANGIAIAPDGDPVISAQIAVADGDDDAWVAKLSAADGSEVWASTYTGETVGGFSTDFGGPVAVDGDGTVTAAPLVRRAFNAFDITLVRIAADGGPPSWAEVPLVDPGDNHNQESVGIVAADGRVAVAISVLGPLITGSRSELFVYDGDTAAWSADMTDLDLPEGAEVRGRPTIDGAGNVMIAAEHFDARTQQSHLLVAEWDAAGNPVCHALHPEARRLDRFVAGAVVLDDGSLVVAGTETTGTQSWVARFRN